MVSTLWLVGGGIVLYTLVAMALKAQGRLPDAIRVQGPITTIHTQRGKAFLDWLAEPKRFWRAWGNLGVGIALVVMVGSFVAFGFAAVNTVLETPEPTQLTQPRNVLAIPGVNDFLPLSAGVEIITGLLIGLVVHEGGHGLLCRVEDIDIDSMGLALLAFIPIGAFVEPDEASRNEAGRGGQTRMFAAGVTNNFAVAVVAFALLFGPVTGAVSVASGVPVGGALPGSPAADGGIERGDVVTGVDGTPVADGEAFDAALSNSSAETVTVQLADGGTVTVRREVVVTGAIRDAPVAVNGTIAAVNGTAVSTVGEFRAAVADRPVAELTTGDGETVVTPVGSYGLVSEDGALRAATGLDAGDPFVVTAIEGARVVDSEALNRVLDGYEPGETVTVTGYTGVDGARRSVEVTLGGSGTDAVLGVFPQRGVTGMTLDDFGIEEYPAGTILTILGGDAGGDGISAIQQAALVFFLPFASLALPGIGYNFAGFVGPIANFYTVTGPLGLLGTGTVLFGANLLFWTGWINVLIGQFNCVPTYPLDGGHILRTSTESIVSRLPVADRRSLTSAVTTTVSLVMVVSLLVMVFGPQLLQ